jgi:hypothetical protein
MRHTDVTNLQFRIETSSKLVAQIANSEGNVGEFELLFSDNSSCEAQTSHLIYILMKTHCYHHQ